MGYHQKVLLLDEPMGALDRKLRQQLGADLRRIQQETRTTAIYVTRDQSEAFQLSDKIVVMDHGRIKQQGRPQDLFVASFRGDTNVLTGTVLHAERDAVVVDVAGSAAPCAASHHGWLSGREVTCTLRPEEVRLGVATPAGAFEFGPGRVTDRVFLGDRTRMSVGVRGRRTLTADAVRDDLAPELGSEVRVYWRTGAPVLLGRP